MRQKVPYANFGQAGAVLRNFYWTRDRVIEATLNARKNEKNGNAQTWNFHDGSRLTLISGLGVHAEWKLEMSE